MTPKTSLLREEVAVISLPVDIPIHPSIRRGLPSIYLGTVTDKLLGAKSRQSESVADPPPFAIHLHLRGWFIWQKICPFFSRK